MQTNGFLQFRNISGQERVIKDFPDQAGILKNRGGGVVELATGLKPTTVLWENTAGSNRIQYYLYKDKEYFITVGYSVKSNPYQVQALQRIYVCPAVENGTSYTRSMFFPILCCIDGEIMTRKIYFSCGGTGMGVLKMTTSDGQDDTLIGMHKLEEVVN